MEATVPEGGGTRDGDGGDAPMADGAAGEGAGEGLPDTQAVGVSFRAALDLAIVRAAPVFASLARGVALGELVLDFPSLCRGTTPQAWRSASAEDAPVRAFDFARDALDAAVSLLPSSIFNPSQFIVLLRTLHDSGDLVLCAAIDGDAPLFVAVPQFSLSRSAERLRNTELVSFLTRVRSRCSNHFDGVVNGAALECVLPLPKYYPPDTSVKVVFNGAPTGGAGRAGQRTFAPRILEPFFRALGVVDAAARAAARPAIRIAAPPPKPAQPPFLRLLTADFYAHARVGSVREMRLPKKALVLDVSGAVAQPVLLRFSIDEEGSASWAHFTGDEARAQRALGDAWTEPGEWGSAATSQALLSDPVFDFPPGAVLVPLLDTTLYCLEPLTGARAAPNLALLQRGKSTAVLAYHATAASGTNPFVLVRPSNRLNTPAAKATIGRFRNRKKVLQHAALVGHLDLSQRFNLLAPLAVNDDFAARLFFTSRKPAEQPPPDDAAELAQGQPSLSISAQHRPAAPVFPPEFDDDTARSVSPFDVYLRLHAAAARAVSAAFPLPPDVRDAAHRYLFTLLGGVVRLNPPRFALNTRDAHWFSRVDR